MSGAPYAARLGDPVAHTQALAGFLAGAVVGLVAATEAVAVVAAVVGSVALEVGTAGLATPLIVGVAATAVELGVGGYVGAKLMGAAEEAGEALGADSLGPTSGVISLGSPNVRVNGRPAARATDPETCHVGLVAQGSLKVHVNGLPASRVGDKTSCGAVITAGSTNVVIEGPPDTRVGIQPEVPEWVRWAVIVVSILPALGQAARGIGPVLAEVRAAGLPRALQTGVKALGRVMEERGGGVRAPVDPAAPAGGGEPPIPPGGSAKVSDFSAKRPGGVDMDNLSPQDSTAADAMERGDWDPKMKEQVLNSGDDFGVRPGAKDEPMYKFSSAGRDEAGAPDSAYYTDQAGYSKLEADHYDPDTDTWNGKGVKNDIALPCYNSADAVWKGTLNSDQLLVTSTTNPASETVSVMDADGSTISKYQRIMPGGGAQVTPAKGGVGNLMPFSAGNGP